MNYYNKFCREFKGICVSLAFGYIALVIALSLHIIYK